jgi:hypothetical protein
MSGEVGVATLAGVHIDRRAATECRAAALEFLHGEIDALAIERPEGALETSLGHEPDQVSVLAAGKTEESAVRTVRVREDGPASKLEKRHLSALEPLAHDPAGFVHRDRTPEKCRQSNEEPCAGDDLTECG